jgi:tyrosinase
MSDETIQPTPSRYQRVQAILDQAAGDSTADYQGFGPFWQLPYDEFIRFKIYDIPLIATGRAAVQPGATGRSAGPASACGCEPTTDSVETPVAAATSSAGRGASSGLVRGLRGEWPFDGSHFPRLPWGGTAVSASDIRFIESWIEEGYPETDHASSTEPPKQPPSSTPGWRQACPGDPANEPANDFHWQHGQALVRKNYEYLSDEELCRLRFAIRAVKKLNAYPADNRSFDAWARVHGDHCQHGWE